MCPQVSRGSPEQASNTLTTGKGGRPILVGGTVRGSAGIGSSIFALRDLYVLIGCFTESVSVLLLCSCVSFVPSRWPLLRSDFIVVARHAIEAKFANSGVGNMKGANLICLAYEHKTAEARLAVFDKAYDETCQRVLSARIGTTSEDHVVARHSAMPFQMLKHTGQVLLRSKEDLTKNKEWVDDATKWQYHFMAQLLAIKHNVPSLDAAKVLDYIHTSNDFKVDRKLQPAKAIDVYYTNFYNFASTSFQKWLDKVRSGALEREKADRSNTSRASKRNRAEFRESNTKPDNTSSSQKKWQSGGTGTRT